MASVADITRVVVPDEAEAGTRVIVIVWVRNIAEVPAIVAVTSWIIVGATTTAIDIDPDWMTLQPGEERAFGGSFIMPKESVTVAAVSWYLTEDGRWVKDDAHEEFIRLREPLQPTFSNLAIEQYKEV